MGLAEQLLVKSERGRRCSTVIPDAPPCCTPLGRQDILQKFSGVNGKGDPRTAIEDLWRQWVWWKGAPSRPSISEVCRTYLAPPPLPPKPVAQMTTRPMQPSSRPCSPSLQTSPCCCRRFLRSFLVALGNWPPMKSTTLLSRVHQIFHGVCLSGSTLPVADATKSMGSRGRATTHPRS